MLKQTEQRVNLTFRAGRFDGQRLRVHVDHAHTEQTHNLEHVGTVGFVGADLDEHKFAFDRVVRIQLDDLQHMQQLVELLDNLLQRYRLDIGRHRDAGDIRAFRRRNGQRVDVERTTGEQAGHAREHARTVFDQHGQGVTLGTGL